MENFRLKVFRAVAHHRSFTRAGEELLLTQPAVTQQIKALENEVGVPLFDRSGRRIELTRAGQTLLEYVERLKKLSDEAMDAVGNIAGSSGGGLALGASQTIGQYVLPALIAGFLREHPRVAVTAISGNTDAMLAALKEHRVQLALIEGPGPSADVHMEPFMQDEMVLVVPASHEWANQTVAVDELAKASLVMREVGSGSRRVVEQALSEAGLKVKELRTTMELDSTEGLLSAVEAGLGVSFVSRWAVRNQLELGTLAEARVSRVSLRRNFSVAYAAGPEPRGNAGAFCQFLRARSMKMGGIRLKARATSIEA